MTGRAASLAALAALAARRVELFEAALAAADAAAVRAPEMARPLTRFRARDTRREDAAHARAVALAGLERARLVEAAVAEELAGEAEAAEAA